jgi:hypothetical protein
MTRHIPFGINQLQTLKGNDSNVEGTALTKHRHLAGMLLVLLLAQ